MRYMIPLDRVTMYISIYMDIYIWIYIYMDIDGF